MKGIGKFLIVICSLLYGQETQAQLAITAAGGNAIGTGGSASYTVGQLVYTTFTGIEGAIAQGVQQPYEISVVTAIEKAKDIILEIQVYPNPATDFIKLKIEDFELINLRYRLYNVNGSLLQNNKIENAETNITLSNYSTGTYFLKIIQDNKLVKSFKIIKN